MPVKRLPLFLPSSASGAHCRSNPTALAQGLVDTFVAGVCTRPLPLHCLCLQGKGAPQLCPQVRRGALWHSAPRGLQLCLGPAHSTYGVGVGGLLINTKQQHLSQQGSYRQQVQSATAADNRASRRPRPRAELSVPLLGHRVVRLPLLVRIPTQSPRSVWAHQTLCHPPTDCMHRADRPECRSSIKKTRSRPSDQQTQRERASERAREQLPQPGLFWDKSS